MKRLRRIFMKLASINTPSGYENRVMPYIMKRLMCSGFKVALDKSFNIIAYRGLRKNRRLPLLCAHADTVNRNDEEARIELAYNNIRKTIHTTGNKNVLGGDDKCGIAVILRLAELAKQDKLRFAVLITRGEERGQGAHSVNKEIYGLVKYGIVIDRRGNNDIVVKIGGKSLCSQHFAEWVQNSAPEGLKPTMIESCHSDAAPIADHVNVVNISCGYHDPHSSDEYVYLDQLSDTMAWVKNMLRHSYKPLVKIEEPEKKEECKALEIVPPKTVGPAYLSYAEDPTDYESHSEMVNNQQTLPGVKVTPVTSSMLAMMSLP